MELHNFYDVYFFMFAKTLMGANYFGLIWVLLNIFQLFIPCLRAKYFFLIWLLLNINKGWLFFKAVGFFIWVLIPLFFADVQVNPPAKTPVLGTPSLLAPSPPLLVTRESSASWISPIHLSWVSLEPCKYSHSRWVVASWSTNVNFMFLKFLCS